VPSKSWAWSEKNHPTDSVYFPDDTTVCMHVNSLKGIAHRILVLEAQLAFTLEKLSENANDSNLQAEADALKKEIRRLKWRIPLAYLKGGFIGVVVGAVGIVLIL
jgi:hypothetical protein